MERRRKGTEESHVRSLERNREAVGRKKEQGRSKGRAKRNTGEEGFSGDRNWRSGQTMRRG